ncbi:hypothetical protein [Salinisphaera sp. LB1]|uniref:hypothetical protein n=1 Tax=Salinisphaera sp. LB1 TaxID=2183911 RepID=UPI0011AB3309|nr:hypothetical protein [Salinisphaera sp. LB1]
MQLLGAWLAGLLAIDGSFLFAAVRMGDQSWAGVALVIAAILNVPLFLAAVFLLQTRFRPELQEDSYYSSYLSSKTNEPVKVSKTDTRYLELRQQISELEEKIISQGGSVQTVSASANSSVENIYVGINKHLENRKDIKQKLRDCNIIKISIFGPDEPPEGLNISISEHLSAEQSRFLIGVARDLGFETYNFFDNRAEETEEDILFGSYGPAGFEL